MFTMHPRMKNTTKIAENTWSKGNFRPLARRKFEPKEAEDLTPAFLLPAQITTNRTFIFLFLACGCAG